jgi:ATP-binding cassette subfamily F protein uup
MTPILSLNDVSLAYGHVPLLEHVELRIAAGERVCLVGRNGSGKSTLLRVISGAAQPDDGEVWRNATVRVSHLEQEVLTETAQTVYQVVSAGLGDLGQLLSDYHQVAHEATDGSRPTLDRLSQLQHRIDALHGWNIHQKVDTALTRLSLPADKTVATCSGGERRRVMLAQALVSEPDLLLLDEPSNHMDIAAITWLEEFLLAYRGALLFVTHDRTSVRHLATRIIELDRGNLLSFPGDYDHYLRKKEDLLDIEAKTNAKFDKKLADSETWIRLGLKARRTRNEGRVKALEAMRKARRQRINVQRSVKVDLDEIALSGKLVADLRHVSFAYRGHSIIRDFSTRVLRGDRVGILGPNGVGKTTLLRLIVGELQPASGQVVLGTRLQLAYFDQNRTKLNPDKTVRDNLCDGKEYINVRGRSRHVIGYLKDFLFPPERIDSPVKTLSGGERNRLLLAGVLAQSANVLVLDEPTNDLDVDTLELLEERLAEFDGTLLLVSHDRSFLDNVVTSTIVFEGEARVEEYVGGYEDWLLQRASRADAFSTQKPRTRVEQQRLGKEQRTPARKARLTYKEMLELDALPQRIEQLEQELRNLEHQVSTPSFYQQDQDAIRATLALLTQTRSQMEDCFARWERLDQIASGENRS